MDDQPQPYDPDRSDGQAMSMWLASEAFTEFMTAAFGAAVKHLAEEQAAKDLLQPR